jgi:quinate dehydrogenase (quinone)
MNSSARPIAGQVAKAAAALLGLVMITLGLALGIGGITLIGFGGSWYFALAGIAITVAGMLVVLRRRLGAWLYFATVLITAGWALWERGLQFWPLFSRLFALASLALPLLLLLPHLSARHAAPSPGRLRMPSYAVAAALVLTLGATLWSSLQPRPEHAFAADTPAPVAAVAVAAQQDGEWRHWGRTPSGTRFAPLDQITPANVSELQVAWTYRTGEVPEDPATHVATPLHINGVLYACTQSSKVFALDADTGQERWSFDPNTEKSIFPRCRGVGYHDGSATAAPVAAAVSATSQLTLIPSRAADSLRCL